MAKFHIIAGAGETPSKTAVRRIGWVDIRVALAKGCDDFKAMPSQIVFLCLLYPVVGLILVELTAGQNALPLLYPLMSGFALIGPFAAVGLFEISRRRELGLDTSWRHAFEVRRSPAIASILGLGLLLMAIFLGWLVAAQAIYEWLFGPTAPESYSRFLAMVLTTSKGWTLIVLGNATGFVFAVVAFSISVVSFPLLLDRDVGAAVAVLTSIRVVWASPVMMALWGLIVACALAIGFAVLFFGLAIVMPVLGHSTWHLYRKAVEPVASVE